MHTSCSATVYFVYDRVSSVSRVQEHTRVGSANSQDIQLCGMAIQAEHCVIDITENNGVVLSPHRNARYVWLMAVTSQRTSLCTAHLLSYIYVYILCTATCPISTKKFLFSSERQVDDTNTLFSTSKPLKLKHWGEFSRLILKLC